MEAAMKTTTKPVNLVNRFEWENTLTPGTEVVARWTNNFSYWHARAEIVRVNRASVRVRLVEAIFGAQGQVIYPAGREIVVPRCVISARTWSINNCVAPE
jgi:hypothetical protein